MILFTLALLALMEVSLSFDNAVLNAAVLKKMPCIWQTRFLTWGMLIAVAGMRLVFPVLIVCIASGLPITQIAHMAIYDPAQYGDKLAESHINISSFGGMFLLLVFLEFICDSEKELHWLGYIEKKLSSLGFLKGIEIIIAASLLILVQFFIPTDAAKISCLLSGMLGVILYTLIQSIMGLVNTDGESKRYGLMAFLYLEVLDASCSLDGVIGAFALTNNITLIMIGLGTGAFAIRSLTVYLVRGGILQEFAYLEHGAHYGIGALAVIMLINTFYAVPEPITGLIGMSFIGLSFLSSVRENRK